MKWRECVGVSGFLHEAEEKLEAKCDHTLTVRASDLPNTQKDLTVIIHDTSIHSSQREAVCTEELAWWSGRRSAGDRWSTESLKVAVHLKAVIPRVSHNHVTVGGEGETLRPVQRIRRRVDVRQEGTAPIKHLMRRREGQDTDYYTHTHIHVLHTAQVSAPSSPGAVIQMWTWSSHLYATVTPVSYDDISVYVHCHACRSVELTVAFTVRAEFEQELTFSTEHL